MFRLMSTRSVVTSLPSTTIPGRDEHAPAPVRHVLVGVVADIRIVERSPAGQQDSPPSDFFVTGQSVIEEVEQVVVQRNDFLHELHILHQADKIVGKQLDSWHRADAARIERGRMNVPAFHQAEHFARHAAHDQGFAIERSGKWIQRGHDVGDGAVAMRTGVRRRRRLRFGPDFGIGLLDHLLAEIHADQIVLENIVIEHVLGGFAKIDDPLGDRRRLYAKRHVLRIGGAGGVVVAANAANAAGDEVSVARVFALHENAVPAKDGRGAVALDHMLVLEVDLGKDAEAAHDPGNRVPVHFHQVPFFPGTSFVGAVMVLIRSLLYLVGLLVVSQ